jgi:hypothetical protein
MKQILLVTLSVFFMISANAADTKKSYSKITFLCNFKDFADMRIDADLSKNSATVTPVKGEFASYIDPTWKVAAHFDRAGKSLKSVALENVMPQMVLVGNNADDSQFTLNIAYSFGTPVHATLNAYWDGLDGTHEVKQTDCAELDWDYMKQ